MCPDEQKTILLVEDSTTYAMAEAARLRSFGYKVLTAGSGEEAVELAINNEAISLILMDLELGEGLDGTEAAKRILAVRRLPIIFHTAHTEKEFIDRLKAITRYGVVAKNSGEFILQSTIDMALELFEAHRSISKRKQRETLLSANEYKYRTLVESAADAIFLADVVSGDIIDCNMKAANLIGRIKDEIIGINQAELHPPDKTEQYKQLFRDHIMTGRDIAEDVLVMHKDGHTIPVDIHATVFELDGAEVIMGLFRDITERKKQADELKRTKKRYDLATTIGKVGIWAWDPVTGNLAWNDQTFKILGLEPGAIKPSYEYFMDMLHPEDREVLNKAVLEALQGKKLLDMDCRVILGSGEERICHTTGEVELDADGEGLRMTGTFQDVTESRRTENALRESEELLRSITDNTSTLIFMKDLGGRYLHVNRQYEDLFHVSNATMQGRTDRDIFPQEMADAFVKNDKEVILSGQTIEVEELVPQDDGIHTYLSVKFPIRHASGGIYAVCGIATDITERKRDEEQIYNLAFYDTLTQLPNRRLLNDRMKQAMAASKRSGLYCALLFMDLDNFKSLNDTQGHAAGDLLLTDAASRISSCVREVDTVARFGGDEFVVMLGELNIDRAESVKQAAIVGEKILNILAKPYVLTLQQESKATVITIEHHCTASFGAVMFLGHENGVEDIIKWADIAMYKAKAGGGNLIHFYE